MANTYYLLKVVDNLFALYSDYSENYDSVDLAIVW